MASSLPSDIFCRDVFYFEIRADLQGHKNGCTAVVVLVFGCVTREFSRCSFAMAVLVTFRGGATFGTGARLKE